MDFKLEIRFTGLCAIVPERDLDHPLNEGTVVLVNARNSQHGPHHSLLFFDPLCYVEPTSVQDEAENKSEGKPNALSVSAEDDQVKTPSTNRPASSSFDFDKGRRRGFLLDGEALTVLVRDTESQLKPISRNSLKFVTGKRPNPPQPCPRENDQDDFTWVARNPGYLNPAVLSSADLGYLVAARIHLTAGTLGSDGFRAVDQGRIRWWFDGPEPTALAEQVKWTLDVKDVPWAVGITLVSAPFRGYPPQPPLHLQPNAGVIRVWIVNMPLESLLELEQPARPFDPDHHYEEFYRLCLWAPIVIPQPDLSSFCPPVIAASNPKCPPTYFSPLTFQEAFRSSIRASGSVPPRPDGPGEAQSQVETPIKQAETSSSVGSCNHKGIANETGRDPLG